ncbi:MAG: serine/threonine-protein kinase [Thermoanaerobaculia bacterium]|nr:serine/threonine-protein kinase [Thermoanaerobaculia bacterium]
MSESEEPLKFGRYTVLRTLGKGAMGLVYLGEDPVISRRVAIKVIRAHPDLEGPELEERQARFEREFKSAGNLSHPNIVTVYDVGKEANDSYITMEYVQGESLESVLKAGRSFTFREMSEIAAQIASALDYAHQQGIVHRDIKPANILMTTDGRPKITDFGVAKLQTSGMTSTGMIIGTPMYMSPEQITGREVSGASDQFSLAAMLYELMTGEPPFQGDNPTTIMYQVVHNEPEPPHNLNKSLPEAVDKAVLRGMAKKIQARYESCSELAEAIGRALSGAEPGGIEEAEGEEAMETVALRADEVVLEDKPAPTRDADYDEPEKKTWMPIAAAVAGVALLGGLGWFATRDDDRAGVVESAADEVSASVEVISDPPGAEIFVDGEDRGLTTPAFVSIEGVAGDVRELELRRDGATVARTQIVMGSAVPSRWNPELLPPPERWTITSDPPGATVSIDGEVIGKTPTQQVFAYGESYDVAVELDGYQSADRTIDLAAMDADAKAGRDLNFRLAKVIPPGNLVVKASYPVTITVDGRRQSGSRLALRPGTYQVSLAAPEVFYFASRSVTIRSGETTELSLPAATPVTIAATPSNCKIRIDGRDAGFVPVNTKLSIGRHEIEFLWESIGRSLTVTEDVGTSTQRIFRAAPQQ